MGAWSSGPFLISAAPGAGKTRPALEFARDLLRERAVQRVAVVCPTTALTRQCAAAAPRGGRGGPPPRRAPRPGRGAAAPADGLPGRRGDVRARRVGGGAVGAPVLGRHAGDRRRGPPPRRGPRVGHRLRPGVPAGNALAAPV